jgi:signal transduction histidine kinase
LAAFIREHRDELVERWRSTIGATVSSTPPAGIAPLAGELFAAVAHAIEQGRVGGSGDPPAARYALSRLQEGAAVGQVLSEFTAVREAIVDVWNRRSGHELQLAPVLALDRLLDSMASEAADRYVVARDGTLRALDRISSVAFESRKVDDLLQGLLHVLMGAASAVETASILLRDGDWLVVRAAAGLEELLRGGAFRVRIGEGVAGRVAAERRPRLLGEQEIVAQTVSPVLRAKGMRSLYSVPLLSAGELLGVAQIGSSAVSTFSDHDRARFEDMCARATAAIKWQLLRDALQARVGELETLIESIPDAVLVAGADGVHHANRAALDLFGADSITQLNREATTLAELVSARHAEDESPLTTGDRFFPAALRGVSTTREILVRNLRTGADVALRCSAAPVRAGDGIAGAVALCTDITERRRDEAERERLYQEARRAAADRQHVLGVVSHDLRNALSTIVIASETMQDPQLSRELGTRGLAAITRAAARMNRLIADLLDVHSVEAGRLSLKIAPTDARSVVDEVVGVFAAQAAARGLALQTELPDETLVVRGDHHRLVQALANLVSNALKVTVAGSVTIRLRRHQSDALFSVVDTGPGFPSVDEARIFTPYWRAEDAGYQGTGLGLAIVRGVVEGHGGRVWMERPAEGGAAVLFTIPMA